MSGLIAVILDPDLELLIQVDAIAASFSGLLGVSIPGANNKYPRIVNDLRIGNEATNPFSKVRIGLVLPVATDVDIDLRRRC